jgi:tetratricopeptide (TPR) repeat protein
MRWIIQSVICLVLTLACNPASQSTMAATMPAADKVLLEKLRLEGLEDLYNLEYESAREKFNRVATQFPDHPAGQTLLATGLWLRALNESRRLQSTIYTSKSFYSKSNEQVDQNLVNQFRDHTRRSRLLAEARLKQNPNDVESIFYLGATEGLKAAFAGTVERRFIAALRSGSSCIDRHRQVLKLDPGFYDAEVSVGMYEYVAGDLPLPVRIVASISGRSGSKKRGVQILERVAERDHWSRYSAMVLLIPIYKRERLYDKAISAAEHLANRFPRNYIFKLEVADALVYRASELRQKGSPEAIELEKRAFVTFDQLLRDRDVKKKARSLDLIHYKYGEALMQAGKADLAAAQFLAAASTDGAKNELGIISRLRAAQSMDMAGKRREAVAEYQAVLQRPNVFDSHDEARQGLRGPYKLN